uniref:Alpha-2-macroglobulin domain-containing protein n=1 Tax=Sparus aurata TaxID=8175 RepID=A0A671UCA3_SPAAU
ELKSCSLTKINYLNSSSVFKVFCCYSFMNCISFPQLCGLNRIGQWLNKTSGGKILQLFYSLNSEASEGNYNVIVSVGEEKIYHSFKVEKYVLPKFDVKIKSPDEASIDQDELEAEVCAKYTYGQPVPGIVHVEMCRPLQRYYHNPDNPNGAPEMTAPCHKETKQVQFHLSALLSTYSFTCMMIAVNNSWFVVSVTEGEVSFKLKVSAEIAPDVQIVAYAVLPSETVIAHSADFSTEKCFSNKVSVEFSPSSAVPGEETNLQVTAQPDSLCGVSAVDQSVLIKEPGKTLEAEQVTAGITTDRCRSPNVGLKMATNLFIRVPSCMPGPAGGLGGSYPEDTPPIETVRTFFPETWIWDLVEVGESGTKDVPFTVPDTITTWETEAFCLSPQGFGLAPRKEIKVFQPFFLELSLPYSIIRGEHFELKATVFNYLSSCIMVINAFTLIKDTIWKISYTSCLCGSERKTLSWTMAPSALGAVNVSVTAEAVASHALCGNEIVSVPERGRIDVVTRSLIVKEIDIELPENVIDGSARATLSVLGDILGRALKNLDGLLRMPYGCGEQNMALLAPNIYILQYLRNTQQLTPAITEKSTNYLTSGYQRQLNYKHSDGAYSTFGAGAGNTWLTAFVLRSFAKAQSFIYIDPTKIEESKTWLERKQRENGCFEQSGKLFNNRMKGGVSDEVTLSAYITAAFLEMNTSANDAVVKQSLSCLRESMSDLSNTYTTALLAYVFTLAGDMEARAHLLKHLDTVALRQGGFLHWSRTATETSASLSVEISSYVLLAKLSASPTAEDLGYATPIVRWLTGQQNYYGGFSSTQDTVVALQALALYATLVFSPEGSSTVTVQSPSGQLMFDVNQDNKLLYQEVVLKDVTGKHSLEVKGTACASVQVSHHCSSTYFSYICSTYITTNLSKDIHINHLLEIVQEHPVQNMKPAVVKIYDYYQTSDQAETEYTYPCVAGNNL